MNLFGSTILQGEAHDHLERFYTPPHLASAFVREYVEPVHPIASMTGHRPRAVEPSCGAGSIVRELVRAGWDVRAVDLDPDAAGLRVAGVSGVIGDWPRVALGMDADLVIGNVPFGLAREHVEAARHVAPRVVVILPLALVGTVGFRAWGWTELARVQPIAGRPWNDHVRETAVFEWRHGHVGPAAFVPPLEWR